MATGPPLDVLLCTVICALCSTSCWLATPTYALDVVDYAPDQNLSQRHVVPVVRRPSHSQEAGGVSNSNQVSPESVAEIKDGRRVGVPLHDIAFSASGHEREQTIQDILDRQDPKIPPDFDKDVPTNVTVQLYIVSFDSISESTMDYSMSIFLRQSWIDNRMTYTKLDNLDNLELDSRVMNQVWVPDLFFNNEKRASFHDITVPNKLMHVYPDGRIYYSSRISMTLSCDMFLQKFPFDKQTCSIYMESYGYSTKNIVFKWHEKPVETRDKLKLPQFEFMNTVHHDCTKEWVGTGNYTCLRADFNLVRSFGYYLTQVYIPSVLIVSLSWVSFWLDIEAVPARISLGLLTVLTMTTQSANSRSNLPRVSYIKAIDVWMAMCLFFVFAALIEFAYVNVHSRVEKRRQTSTMGQPQGGFRLGAVQEKNPNAQRDLPADPEDSEGKPRRLFSKTNIGRAKARRLDKLSRRVFPGIFVLFNVIYWLFYIFWDPHTSSFE